MTATILKLAGKETIDEKKKIDQKKGASENEMLKQQKLPMTKEKPSRNIFLKI
jgi:hypothetical protein